MEGMRRRDGVHETSIPPLKPAVRAAQKAVTHRGFSPDQIKWEIYTTLLLLLIGSRNLRQIRLSNHSKLSHGDTDRAFVQAVVNSKSATHKTFETRCSSRYCSANMPPSDLANGVPQPEAGPSSASQAAPHTQGPNGSIPPKNSDSAAAPATANGSGDKPANEGPDPAHMFAARREEELARRDRSLAEFLLMLDGYEPLVSCLA